MNKEDPKGAFAGASGSGTVAWTKCYGAELLLRGEFLHGLGECGSKAKAMKRAENSTARNVADFSVRVVRFGWSGDNREKLERMVIWESQNNQLSERAGRKGENE